MLMTGMHLVFKYDIIGEFASLVIAVLLLFFMLLTKPRQTQAFKFLFFGNLTSIFTILMQIGIVQIASFPSSLYERRRFTAFLIIFLILYGSILGEFFNYIYLMSEKRLSKRYVIVLLYVISIVLYVSGIIYHIYMKNFYYVRTDGIDITHFIRFYCFAGMFCVLSCLFYCIYRRKFISRIVMRSIYIVAPLDFLVLFCQMFDRAAVFSSVTHVVPFVACYILFHSNPYDEDTGCQNTSAMESRLITNTRRGKVYYIAFIEFPQLIGNTRTPDYARLKVGLARTCRKIEKISHKILLYRINYGTFAAIMEVKEKSDAETYGELIRDCLDDFYHNNDHLHYFLGIAGDSRKFVQSGNKWTQSFIKYIRGKYGCDGQNIYYFVNDSDFIEYDEIYKIEQTLADIRNNMNPDDERILCYAQPIYSVKRDSFRSAEALMRICIDGKMIPPDEFIGIAEKPIVYMRLRLL